MLFKNMPRTMENINKEIKYPILNCKDTLT